VLATAVHHVDTTVTMPQDHPWTLDGRGLLWPVIICWPDRKPRQKVRPLLRGGIVIVYNHLAKQSPLLKQPSSRRNCPHRCDKKRTPRIETPVSYPPHRMPRWAAGQKLKNRTAAKEPEIHRYAGTYRVNPMAAAGRLWSTIVLTMLTVRCCEHTADLKPRGPSALALEAVVVAKVRVRRFTYTVSRYS